MRALLISLLLLVIPLQVSWAAVGGYCKHESGAATQHLGHHEHQHESNVTSDYVAKGAIEEPTQLNSSGFADSDCAICHASAVAVLTASTNRPCSEPLSASVSGLPDQASTAISYPPERPNWLTLA